MCGLISIIGKISIKEERIFKQGLIVDSLRGDHSTGIAATKRGKDGETRIAKQVGNPFELFNDKRFDTAMAGLNRVLIGHNRYATQGGVNKANAHPFEFWPVYGAHNGTLTNKHVLEDGSKYTVDSQALLNHISVHGVEDAIPLVTGAWALTWWNEEDQTFNVLRNKERTLYYTKDKKSDVWYFCSEKEMLILLLNRNGVEHEKIALLTESAWLSFPIAPEGEVGKPRIKIVKGKEVVQASYGTGSSSSSTKTSSNAPSTVEKYKPNVLRKNVLLSLVNTKTDKEGKEYFEVRDLDNPLEDIRVYPPENKGIKFPYKAGDVVWGSITFFQTAPEPFYRIGAHSLSLATIEETHEYDLLEEVLFAEGGPFYNPESEDKEEVKLLDHKGNPISKSEWQDKYPYCQWCTGNIDPDHEGNFLSKNGTILCPDCANDKEARSYVTE